MTEPAGALCLVLHGHLPYVLHHGGSPHGEAWLYEGAAETYLPLLDLLAETGAHPARPAVTLGLTPVLLEQLAHERFKTGFVAYLNERADRADRDRREFERRQDTSFAELAGRWEQWYARTLDYFERIGRDIPAAFAAHGRAGAVGLLMSTATHAYTPLLLNDQSIRAQLACGTQTTRHHLGTTPGGMWLPECAYRPTWDRWVPSVLYDDPRYRVGLEHFIAEAGVTHFVVDTHLMTGAEPLGITDDAPPAGQPGGRFREVGEPQLFWDRKRGWRDPLRPAGVASTPEAARVFAFARHPRVSEQVWSGTIGYPASPEYLDFHRRHGDAGLRYHRVTDSRSPLPDKLPYEPEATGGKIEEHARHFCDLVRGVLQAFRRENQQPGVCVAPFDAELFGHWWFEGPQFLRAVISTFAADGTVELLTTDAALARHPTEMVVRMPEGSWGEHGNHGVWINDRTRWLWEMEYRAEDRLLDLVHGLPWQANGSVRTMLERAGRELLLLQASDWPFVIHSEGAVDYGIQRFAGHYTRFDRMATAAAMLASGAELGRLEQVQVDEADLHDSIFPTINLGWWM